jgi:TIR domain
VAAETRKLSAVSDVFLSYSHEDIYVVRLLATAFAASDLECWWDRNLLPGREFDRQIEHRLCTAKAVVVVWSRQSVESRWVRTEAGEALNQRKMVPARVDDCDIPLEFRRIQTAQLTGWKGETGNDEFRRLLSGIKSLSSPGGGVSCGDERTKQSSQQWLMDVTSFEWNGVRFKLTLGDIKHFIENRNHEAIYVNGTEVCRAGSARVLHPAFQFYVYGSASRRMGTCAQRAGRARRNHCIIA